MDTWTREFLELALEHQALKFGRYTLKSGRASPYFFNAGAICDGAGVAALARCYASAIDASAVQFDVLFGPAYKGIPLAATVAAGLASGFGRNVGFAFNRKEAKDHGEGGTIVGAPLSGRVLIIDDVISAGTSVRESRALIEAAGALPAGVAIALDRQERGIGSRSATDEVRASGLPVISIASLDDLIAWLQASPNPPGDISAMLEYRRQYGASNPSPATHNQ